MTSSVEYRVVCKDGSHHGDYSETFTDEFWLNAEWERAERWSGCSPHSIESRTVTVSEWKEEKP